MKKIILGLFLTVGISGMALAGNESNTLEPLKNLEEKSELRKAIDKVDFDKPFDCWYGTRTDYYTDGVFTASISTGFAAACLPGDEDGTISVRFKTVRETTGLTSSVE